MSKIGWDWRSWLGEHPRCTHCHESINENPLIRVIGKPYHKECWERLTKK